MTGLVGFFDLAVGRRIDAWYLAWDYFLASPWIGIGVGNFGYQEYNLEQGLAGVNFVNNQPLEVLAETGVFGFLFYTLLNGLVFVYGVRLVWQFYSDKQKEEFVLTLGAVVAYLGIMTQFMTVSNWNVFHYWLVMGVIFWMHKLKSSKL